MKKPTSVLIFGNFMIAVCDERGQQVPELQGSLLTLLAEHFQRHSYDLNGCTVETTSGNWQVNRTEDGWRSMRVP